MDITFWPERKNFHCLDSNDGIDEMESKIILSFQVSNKEPGLVMKTKCSMDDAVKMRNFQVIIE